MYGVFLSASVHEKRELFFSIQKLAAPADAKFSCGRHTVSTCGQLMAGSHVGQLQLSVRPHSLLCGSGSSSRKHLLPAGCPPRTNVPTRLVTLTLVLPHKRDMVASCTAVTSSAARRLQAAFQCLKIS